jgi:hypothetical protein
MVPEMKKRFGAIWVKEREHGQLHWLIRVVSPDQLDIYHTGDIEVVGKREWERWG